MAEEITFEQIYAQAGDDLSAIPWATLSPLPALVVACGLGDDAEEVSRRGYRVTAFDLVPAAIAHCRARFPGSAVDYRIADVFRLPGEWQQAFDLASGPEAHGQRRLQRERRLKI